jgi:acetyl esterase/lipase
MWAQLYLYDPTQILVHATETDAHGCRPCIPNRASEPQNAMPTDRGAPCPQSGSSQRKVRGKNEVNDRKSPTVTPFYSDFTGLPPTMVHVSSRERLHDDSITVVERMRTAGVAAELKIIDGMCHTWQLYAPMLDECWLQLKRVRRLSRRTWRSDEIDAPAGLTGTAVVVR